MIIGNILGNLGADAEVKTINGRQFAAFRIASRGRRKEDTTWVSVLATHNEKLMPYLVKGQGVMVSGELEVKPYDTRDGKTGVDVSVFANSLALAGAKGDGVGNNTNEPPKAQNTEVFGDKKTDMYSGEMWPSN